MGHEGVWVKDCGTLRIHAEAWVSTAAIPMRMNNILCVLVLDVEGRFVGVCLNLSVKIDSNLNI